MPLAEARAIPNLVAKLNGSFAFAAIPDA
jgi:hypothetical protein